MKALFTSRLFREKVLFIALLLVAVFIWGSSLMEKFSTWSQEMKGVNTSTEEQLLWIEQAPFIETRQRKAIENLEFSRSYDGLRLQSEISSIASRSGLGSADISTARTTSTPNLAIHTVTIHLRNTSLGSLVSFYKAVSERFPYIGIDRCRIDPNRNNPQQLSVTIARSAEQVMPPKP